MDFLFTLSASHIFTQIMLWMWICEIITQKFCTKAQIHLGTNQVTSLYQWVTESITHSICSNTHLRTIQWIVTESFTRSICSNTDSFKDKTVVCLVTGSFHQPLHLKHWIIQVQTPLLCLARRQQSILLWLVLFSFYFH